MQAWQRQALLLAGALALLGLTVVYARQLEAAAEIDWLEQIPVLDEEPA